MDEVACNASDIGRSVPVRLRSTEGEILTHAMLDACSTGSFVLEDIVSSLGVKGADTQLMVKTVNGTKLYDAKVLNGLVVSDLKGDNTVQLPKIFTKRTFVPVRTFLGLILLINGSIKDIEADLPPQLPNAKISLLIESNCPKALQPIDVLASKAGGPFAIKTFAGWAIVALYTCATKSILQ